MNTGMTEKRIKTIFMLMGEAIVIWYGMGTPIPTNWTDTIKLIVALLAITYTGWKNHDFTAPACEGTGYTHFLKAQEAGETFGVNVDGLEYLEDGDQND